VPPRPFPCLVPSPAAPDAAFDALARDLARAGSRVLLVVVDEHDRPLATVRLGAEVARPPGRAERIARAVAELAVAARLTPRHVEVLHAATQHGSAREIASALGVRTRTVEAHVRAILARTGERRLEAVVRRVLSSAIPA
jgi:FixJ family two-component response regulator